MAEKDLKNTLLIYGTEYDINAVYSDKAGKVANPLTVKRSGNIAFSFDGSTANQTIDYVPASGGTYSGFVHITGTADITNDPTYDSAVLTSSQVQNRIANLNGSPVCVWNADNNYQMHSLKDKTDKTYKLTTVVGTSDSFDAFKNYISNLSKGLKFTLNSDKTTCYVAGIGTCTDTKIRVPEYNEEGIPVTHIGSSAFMNNTNITEVVIPCGITYIGADAFYGCTALQKVTLADSVTRIKESAFYGCTNLTDINLGAGLKEIGDNAFHSCVNLEGISLPNSITKIANGLFYGCSKLVSIILPEGTTHIGHTAFYDCTTLTTIVIPKSVISIDYSAFGECRALNSPADPEVHPDLTSGVSYSGTQEEWNTFIASGWDNTTKLGIHTQQNSWLTTAELVEDNFEYPQADTITGGAINISDIVNGPFIYICRDTDEEFNSANKMFIKLPGDDQIVEISRGATVLSSNYTSDGYTYEGLAEALARINKRLEAIGGTELKINNDQTTLIKVPTIQEVNSLVVDKEIVEYLDPNSIPTVQELKQLIDLLRADLDDLTAEVMYELEQNPDNPIFAANSRIDKLDSRIGELETNFAKLEAAINNLKDLEALTALKTQLSPILDAFVDEIEYPDTLVWTD